jgi:3',5'-cyclic AMP phosphodiesterase CpdA
MRVAVVSDIHGNLTALEAVIADLERRAPDLVIHGGDLAVMGGQPAEVIDRSADSAGRRRRQHRRAPVATAGA